MLALSPSRALLHPSLSAAAHAALRRSISLGDSSHRLRFKSLRAPTALRRISNSSSPAKSASRGHWDESDDGHGSEYDEVDEEQEDYGIGSTATAEEYEKLVEGVFFSILPWLRACGFIFCFKIFILFLGVPSLIFHITLEIISSFYW